jgi:hypothetical protein
MRPNVRFGSLAAFPNALGPSPLYPQIAADLLHHLSWAAWAICRDRDPLVAEFGLFQKADEGIKFD